MVTRLYVAVVGSGEPDAVLDGQAATVGRLLAQAGAAVVCGGLGGVMEAVCRGAHEAGGTTIGLLPGLDREAANPYVMLPIPTGLGELRNGLVVRAADALIAIGGGYGTLSEIGLALRADVPVVGLGTWRLSRAEQPPDPGIVNCADPADAVRTALRLAGGGRPV